MEDTNTADAENSARVSIFVEDTEAGYPMVVPTDDDVSVFDLGELVTDRIEGNGRVTLPDDLPEAGEREFLGTVYWNERGIPTRLEREDDVVHFTESGGFDRIEE